MDSTIFTVLLPGVLLVLVVVYALLPRWIVITGPDKPSHEDVPKLHRYMNIVIYAHLVLMFVTVVLEFSKFYTELIIFALLLTMSLAFMFLEKKYLPGTRRYLVTLCWIVGMCIAFGIYGWITFY